MNRTTHLNRTIITAIAARDTLCELAHAIALCALVDELRAHMTALHAAARDSQRLIDSLARAVFT